MGVYLYVVKQEGASSEQEHGLKSAALADLQKSALPVPKGFVISQAALDTFISENGLEEKIRSVSETTHKGMTGLEAIQKKIDMIFVKSFMPDAVKSEVLSAYGGLSLSEDVRRADVAALDLIKVGRNHERVAVRSSMVRSPDNSYAGVTSSFLNVTGEDELWRCIKLCWASAFHPHVLLYGERKGVEGLPKMSVIVQRMVDSEKSGSILTNFIRDKVLVEASWGLGSAVSSGIVSPDEYLLDRNGSLLEKNISKKLSMYVRNPMSGKTEKEPVPGSKMDAQVLTDSELRKLCELAEKVQGSKPDQLLIDWCIGRNRAFLLDVKQGNFDIERGDEDPGEALVTGRCASQGTGTGKVIMYPGENDMHRRVGKPFTAPPAGVPRHRRLRVERGGKALQLQHTRQGTQGPGAVIDPERIVNPA
jgi:phosphoenolpyruvate synthase/pyruvate phosphate dikinase